MENDIPQSWLNESTKELHTDSDKTNSYPYTLFI